MANRITTAQMSEMLKKRRRSTLRHRIVVALSCIVVFCTVYALVLPAITMTPKTYCGFEEEHTDECYSAVKTCIYGSDSDKVGDKVLICTESEDASTEKLLICTNEDEDHVHTDECYEEATTGHTHTDECYHIHTEECFEKQLLCGHEIHQHTLQCYSNPDADTETIEYIESTVSGAELTGNYRNDLVSVAKTQLGYTESTDNYKVSVDGVSTNGYTRYGEWYGDAYCDWSATFVSFCLNYAGIKQSVIPYGTNTSEILTELQSKIGDNGYYEVNKDHEPEKGEIVFIGKQSDETIVPDQMGIITEYNKEDNLLKAIVGDSNGCVEEKEYKLSSPSVLGFGITPKNENDKTENILCYEDDIMTVTAVFDKDTVIPEGAELTVSEKALEDDEQYKAISDEVSSESEAEAPQVLSAMTMYELTVTDGDEKIDLSDSTADISIDYKESPFTAAELTDSEVSTLVIEDDESISEAQAKAIQNAAGLAALNLTSVAAPNQLVVALTSTVQSGTYWKKITSLDELSVNDTVLIASADGYLTLAYNTTVYAHLVPVTGNPLYFTADNITNAMKHTVTQAGTTYRFRNQGTTTQYLRLSSSAVYSTTSTTNITVAKVSTEECFTLKNGSYYLVAGDSMKSSSSSSDTAKRSMYIFKLVEATLDIPDEPEGGHSGGIPEDEEPEYDDYIETSDSKTGTTAVNGAPATYASDASTSQIESKFTGTEDDDGKVIGDKSVIYGDDDYDAFDTYESGTFSETLSVLGQTTHVTNESGVPMDVVIILDCSYSMLNPSYKNSDGDVRMIAAIDSLNACIEGIMNQDARNRVGVVSFSDYSQVILPLNRYTKTGSEYVKLSISSVSGDYHSRTQLADISAGSGLKNSSGQSVTIDFEYSKNYNWEGTFTQSGIQEAGDMLLAADTVAEDGTQRKPLIIMISDGGPTLCTNNYESPKSGPIFGNSGNSSGSDNDNGVSNDGNLWGINGYYTVLTANYYKRLVASHYNFVSSYYSIGIGVSETSKQNTSLHDNAYCRAVLDPTATRLAAVSSGSNYTDNEGGAFIRLLNNTDTNDYYAIPNHRNGWTTIGITHSKVPVIDNPYISDYAYANGAYFGDFTTAQMTDVLMSIVEDEQYSECQIVNTLKIDSTLLFTDYLGEGMELKGMPVLRYGGVNYHCISQTVEDSDVIYHYQGTYQYPYETLSGEIPSVDISTITVKLHKNENGTQYIQMTVPVTAFPTYFISNAGGFYFEQLPVRLIFQVGLTDESLEAVEALETGETLTFYTNSWNGSLPTLRFIPNAENQYGDWEQTTLKEENTTQTKPESFVSQTLTVASATSSYAVRQFFGNNGKLTFSKESTTVSVEKRWVGSSTNHSDITVYLLADGEVVDEQTLGASNNWAYTWENLEKYNSQGNEIAYTVSEQYVPGYTSKITSGETVWTLTPATTLTSGKYYVFADNKSGSSTSGYALSGYGDTGNDKLQWLNDISNSEVSSELSIWKASGSGTNMSLENVGRPGWYLYVGGTKKTTSPRNTKYNVYLWNEEFAHWTFTSNNLKANSPESYNFGGIATEDGSMSKTINSRSYTCYYYKDYGYFITGQNNNLTLYEATMTSSGDDEENLFVITNTPDTETPITLNLKKIAKSNSNNILQGAVFALYKQDENGVLISGTTLRGTLIANDITTNASGIASLEIPGGDATYYLVETSPPRGYHPMTEPIIITVEDRVVKASTSVYVFSTNDTTVTVKNFPENDISVQFEHEKTIDYLNDGGDNPDTDLEGEDLYRLYLDMTGRQEPIDLLIVVDGSGSMSKTDMTGSMRRDDAITEFLNGTTSSATSDGFISYFLGLNPENKVSVIQFYGNTSTYGRSTNLISTSYPGYSTDSKILKGWTTSNSFVSCTNQNNNGTNYEAGLKLAADQFEKVSDDGHRKVMIFLSDGVPTFFLVDANDVGAYTSPTLATSNIGQRWGNGEYANVNNYPYCKEPSKKAFDDFHNLFPEVITYTIGVSKDISETSEDESQSPEVLQYIASQGGGDFISVTNDMHTLKLELESIFYPKAVTITDNLSKYDRYYSKQPDVKVTMKNNETGVESVLYENGTNKNLVDEKGNAIFDHIEYTASDTSEHPTGSTGTVKAVFGSNYCLSPDYTYTVSFNVSATRTAYDEYSSNGNNYAGVEGDENTDYGTNATSSEQPGFHSNDTAYVDYIISKVPNREYYRHPVIQVKSAEYELPHTGGNGLIWFTIGGGFLIALALVSGILWRARERRYK